MYTCSGCGQPTDNAAWNGPYTWGSMTYCDECGRKMRCYRHPQIFTPETCSVCKRHVCRDCINWIGSTAYCPDCYPGEGQNKPAAAGTASPGQGVYQNSTSAKPPVSIPCAVSPVFSVIAWIILIILEPGNILFLVPCAAGIILGFVGNRQVRQSYGEKSGRAWAIIGIILGFLSILLWIFEVLTLLF